MKKWMYMTLAALVIVPAAWAQDEAKDEGAEEAAAIILTGEVVELSSYLEGLRGEDNIDEAIMRVDSGMPLAFVVTEEEKETLYLVLFEDGTAPIDMLYDYVGTEVDLTGKVVEKGGAKIVVASEVAGADDWLATNVGSASTQ